MSVVISRVRGEFGLDREEFLRSSALTARVARAASVYSLRQNGLSYSEIGLVLGRNHSTVMGLERSARRYANHPVWRPAFVAATEGT